MHLRDPGEKRRWCQTQKEHRPTKTRKNNKNAASGTLAGAQGGGVRCTRLVARSQHSQSATAPSFLQAPSTQAPPIDTTRTSNDEEEEGDDGNNGERYERRC